MSELKHRTGELIQNRYQIRKIMGSGAFGTVYGCRDGELDVPVAVKELHVLDPTERAEALKLFRAEAQHLSRLRHPHIVSGHYEPVAGRWHICPIEGLDWPGHSSCPDHGAALVPIEARYYLVMEYIAGPDLLRLCERQGGQLPLDEAALYGTQIAEALAHIHARDLVHRDIKPENIRLRPNADKTAEAVLLDFGIATQGQGARGDAYGTQAQRHTQGGGTIGYAPESPAERRNPDARSDIHAWGMTWYHLLTGLDPTDPDQLRRMRLHRPRGLRPDISAAWDELIVNCIDPEPANRPQNGAQLLARLNALSAPPEPVQTVVIAPTPAPVSTQKIQTLAPAKTPVVAPLAPGPLVFRSGHAASTIGELVWLLDAYANEGAQRLFAGEIERWLSHHGETELARQAAIIRSQYDRRPQQGLEAFIAATGLLARPQLRLDRAKLDFGTIGQNGKKTVDLKLENPGRGHLFGIVKASLGAVSTPGGWDGNRARLPVTFDANRLQAGTYQGEIEIESLAGTQRIPFAARVAGPSWWPAFLTVIFCGAAGGISGALARTLPLIGSAPRPGWGWFTAQLEPKWWPVAPYFGATLWACAALWTILEATRKRSCALVIGAGALGTIAALVAGIGGNSLMAQGDIWLKPWLGGHVGSFAAGAWMAAGATLGGAWGALRRARDWFSIRILAVLLGLGASAALVWLAIAGATGR